jgi:L-cysteate sulfo-lyase
MGISADGGRGPVRLGTWPTPVEPAPRLAERLGLDPGCLWLKRDDLTGLGAGGNKVRKLEHLCGAALEQGATALITSGRAQSNHARLTAAAARRLGLGCLLVLGGDEPRHATGNLALEVLLDTPVRWVGDLDDAGLDAAVDAAASELTAAGERVAVIPLGGSDAVGARGYLTCGWELEAQVPGLRHVVVALGTGGTMAGLVGALRAERVLGVDVGATADPETRVLRMLADMATHGATAAFPGQSSLRVRRDQVGPGYGILTAAARAALVDAARWEGIILDPVYTAKALSGLAAEVREGKIARDEPTVFVHTGGLPGLFGHRFIDDPRAEPGGS